MLVAVFTTEKTTGYLLGKILVANCNILAIASVLGLTTIFGTSSECHNHKFKDNKIDFFTVFTTYVGNPRKTDRLLHRPQIKKLFFTSNKRSPGLNIKNSMPSSMRSSRKFSAQFYHYVYQSWSQFAQKNVSI